jgi:hypothetical protein
MSAADSARAAPAHEAFLVYKRFRYLKFATLLCVLSVVAYLFHRPWLQPPNGGTWLGYTLGTIGLLLILWLSAFGWRKRSYGNAGRLEDWLSAHVYLGLVLITVATLHTGFQFGWNVHTLAFVLMMAVILSGAYGVYTYTRYPRLVTANRANSTDDKMLREVALLDGQMRDAALRVDENISLHVRAAIDKTRIGGSMIRILSGVDPNCATAAAMKAIEPIAAGVPAEQREAVSRLMVLLTQKSELLKRLRRDAQLRAHMTVWLYVHVPLTFALLAALLAHVVAVFFYW